MPDPKVFNIRVTVTPEPNGHWLCEAVHAAGGEPHEPKGFHGQNANHAIAMALEDLARQFRLKAEVEQKVDWEAVEHSPSGEVQEKRFHIVVHYECVDKAESKFDAMHDTLLGNTIVENAKISLVQVDKKLPIQLWRRLDKSSKTADLE